MRREIDYRLYHNLFHRRDTDITGFQKAWLCSFVADVTEPDDLGVQFDPSGDVIVTFKGLKHYFEGLNGWNTYLMQELRAITREKWLHVVDRFGEIPVALHVRRGDFARPTTEAELLTRGGIRTPSAWFARCLDTIRSVVGARVRVVIVSDGNDEELRDLLTSGDVELVRTGSAIGDLLVLARARVLIGSGGSTFSAWASFLGQMPTVTVSGQSLQWFKLDHQNGSFVGEFDPCQPNITFLDQCWRLRNGTSGNPCMKTPDSLKNENLKVPTALPR